MSEMPERVILELTNDGFIVAGRKYAGTEYIRADLARTPDLEAIREKVKERIAMWESGRGVTTPQDEAVAKAELEAILSLLSVEEKKEGGE